MPNRYLALEKYRRTAATYDQSVSVHLERLRPRIAAHLNLKPGDAVLDAACGTGGNFRMIQEAIGQSGRLIGIDLSTDMLEQARERVSHNGWQNVILIQATAEDAKIPEQVDAVLFSFTHDVLRSTAALENVMRHVKPRARVVAAGSKWAPWWAVPVNIGVWYIARKYVTTFEGFARPWSHLERFVPDFKVETLMLGAVYVASGTKSGHLEAA